MNKVKSVGLKEELIERFLKAKHTLEKSRAASSKVRKEVNESGIKYSEVNAYLIDQELKEKGLYPKLRATHIYTIAQARKLGIGKSIRRGAHAVAHSYRAILEKGSTEKDERIQFIKFTPLFREEDFIPFKKEDGLPLKAPRKKGSLNKKAVDKPQTGVRRKGKINLANNFRIGRRKSVA